MKKLALIPLFLMLPAVAWAKTVPCHYSSAKSCKVTIGGCQRIARCPPCLQVDHKGTASRVLCTSTQKNAVKTVTAKKSPKATAVSQLRAQSVSDVLKRAKPGQRVVLFGKVLAKPPACTELFCGPRNPCCNTCSSRLYLQSGPGPNNRIDLVQKRGTPMMCVGDSCNVKKKCALNVGHKFFVVGHVINDFGIKRLKVDHVF